MPSEQAPAAEAPLTEVEMVALMEGHYGSAIAAHDALIRGDLETLRSHMSEIPERTLPAAAPESWRSHERRLHDAARAAASASTLEVAGRALAAVAGACGACHQAVALGDIYRKPEPPRGDSDLETAMLKHQWATERLWEGITGPWDDAWTRGAAALAGSPVFTSEEGEGERLPVSAGLHARATAMREMGGTALTTTGLAERAEVYGRLLETCAACHLGAGVTD